MSKPRRQTTAFRWNSSDSFLWRFLSVPASWRIESDYNSKGKVSRIICVVIIYFKSLLNLSFSANKSGPLNVRLYQDFLAGCEMVNKLLQTTKCLRPEEFRHKRLPGIAIDQLHRSACLDRSIDEFQCLV